MSLWNKITQETVRNSCLLLGTEDLIFVGV